VDHAQNRAALYAATQPSPLVLRVGEGQSRTPSAGATRRVVAAMGAGGRQQPAAARHDTRRNMALSMTAPPRAFNSITAGQDAAPTLAPGGHHRRRDRTAGYQYAEPVKEANPLTTRIWCSRLG